MWTGLDGGRPVRQPVAVRWDDLFEDMEAQLAAMRHSELDARVEDLTRAEHAGVSLGSRLRASGGAPVVVALDDGTLLRGGVASAAGQWFELAEGTRRHLVPLGAVSWVQGVGALAAPDGVVERRLGLTHALRALARDRARVVVRTRGGNVVGRIARVGKDYVEVDTAPEPRTAGTAIPLDRVLCVSEVA